MSDSQDLESLGYTQELWRRMSAFSNLAISFSIICILAGGITSFHQGLSSVGGAAFGLGWPLVCLFSLVVAASMGQVASSFPTAGGIYHWASILGGRGWGWTAAWLNLLGLVSALAAVNLGCYLFALEFLGGPLGLDVAAWSEPFRLACQWIVVAAITGTQAWVNHRSVRIATRLIDFSGYWILLVSLVLTVGALALAPSWEWGRLVEFRNYSGARGGGVWPETSSVWWLFALSFLLPAYTVTGFDASAHAAEETVGAAHNVPRGIVRSVLLSAVAGWIMLSAIVVGVGDLDAAAASGSGSFQWILSTQFPAPMYAGLSAAIVLAQYLCGMACLMSASRMVYAFARDGGMPLSGRLRVVCSTHRVPVAAIWTVAVSAVGLTLYAPVYSTVAAVCAAFLYLSYAIPIGLGLFAHGRGWTRMGPWHLGAWYRPCAAVAVLGCVGLIIIGVQPPNEKAAVILGGSAAMLVVGWWIVERRRFKGPPALRQV